MYKLFSLIIIFALIFSASLYADYKLVWSDEFDHAAIDRETWKAETNPGVIYNAHQKQFYTDKQDNSFIKDGKLIIRAKKEHYVINEYTSARLNTYGNFGLRYGKIEARIKTASADGLRSKLFMLPEKLEYGAWSRSGQIDIMETQGANPDRVKGGIFYGGQGHYNKYTGGEYASEGIDFSADYHVYTVEWQPYEIRWFIDGKLYAMQNRWSSFSADYPAPFDKDFFLVVSLAVDGDIDDSQFPAEMSIDWIRAYQIEGNNQPPQIKIISPANGSSIDTGNLQITVNASDKDNNLKKVEFYNHNDLLGTAARTPYNFTWNVPDGCHTLTARAVDDAGFGCSDSIEFVAGVGCPPSPYHGSPIDLPGRVEAEDFDTSPKEKAYWDTNDSNEGGAYRETGVDIQDCLEGGYNLGWLEPGEWLEYTVNVKKAGKYDIVCRTGSPWDGGKLHVEFDGVNKTGTLEIVNTGDWQNYTHLIKRNAQLKAGLQKMKVVIEGGGFNFNYIEVNPSKETSQTNQNDVPFLDGTSFVDKNGDKITLKGCNIGSWLNLEMWMMDIKDDEQYPDQYTIETVLQKRFGKTEKDRIMDLHRANWITDRDFENIQSLGFNCIRVPFHYNIIEDDDNPMHLKKDAWRWFDYIIEQAEKYNLYVILDLHAAPGCQNAFDHSGRKEWNKLWEDKAYWKRTAWLWEQIAERYKDNKTIICFQPINEPWGGSTKQQTDLFDYLYKAIRKHDKNHVIIASAHFTGFNHFGDPKDHNWIGVGYSQNFYPGLFGGGAIAPETHKGFFQWLDDELAPKLKALNTPFLVTEFNVVFNAAGGGEMMRRHYDAYEKHDWAATMWSYKLITSPGRKNTGGWWLVTNTGSKKTGAWWIVTNKTALPAVDFNTASKNEIEEWFKAFSTVEYELNEGLYKALTAEKSPEPIETLDIEKMTVAPAQDDFKGWTAIDINNPLKGGQKVVSDTAIDLYAAGSDVYGAEDQFRFVYKKMSGDFTLSATIDHLTFTNTYAKAGLMVRKDLDKNSMFATSNVFPDGSVEFGIRPAKGLQVSTKIVMGTEMPDIHIKFVRKGNMIERYFACGQGQWDKFDSVELTNLGTDVYAGLFCTSHDNEALAKAKFKNIKVISSPRSTKAEPVITSICYPNYTLENGELLLGNNNYRAISYSGDRTVARTTENSPSMEDIEEDIKILSAMGVKILRTYNTAEFPQSERILKVIRKLKKADPDFEMYVMLGAWINCKGAFNPNTDHSQEDAVWNKAEIEKAIELANAYPDVAKIIAVGNEAMVTWQAHFVHPSVILKWVNYLKQARVDGRMPANTLVTTSDNWAALGGEESYHNEDLLELLRQIDFISLHTYAFHGTHYDQSLQWGVLPEEAALPITDQAKRSIARAIENQKSQFNAVKKYLKDNDINKAIHIGETGWATLDNELYGYDGTCAGDEYISKLFYNAVMEWTTKENLTCFYFEAFDEPWKSNGTDGSEGHFGLFTVDGKAKYAIWHLVDAKVFDSLIRGGNPIIKTHNGNETIVLEKLKMPASKK